MPSVHAAFSLLPLTQIQPQGWIAEFLRRQRAGLTGHIEVAGYPFNTCMWAGERIEGSPTAWWPYEQTAYYLDGALRVGHLLRDDALLGKVRRNFAYVRDHVSASGRFGTELRERFRHWPYASLGRSLMAEHGAGGDPAIVDLLHRHYQSFVAADFADVLELANAEQLCWLHEQTGDAAMLAMAEQAYALFKADARLREWAGTDIDFRSCTAPDTHGVVYLELLKIPALLYRASGKLAYLQDALCGAQTLLREHLLVSGLPSSTEHFAGRSASAGTETCNASAFVWTWGTLLQVTGEAHFGDALEKAVFNGGLGAITKDFRAHQYFSAPNQAVCAADSNPFGHHPARMAYLPGHDVECCTGNVNRFMPYFVQHLWLAGSDGLVAALLGPCRVNARVGAEATEVTIDECTNYPFDERVVFRIRLPKPTRFALTLRIPQWCRCPQVLVNGVELVPAPQPGRFCRVERTFADGDEVMLLLPMDVALSHWPDAGVAVERGPLVYSLPLRSHDSALADYPKSNPQFPAIARSAAQPWNYALDLNGDAGNGVTVHQAKASAYPWDDPPVSLQVPARRVPAWQLNTGHDERLGQSITHTPGFPSPLETGEKVETIELVPYGSTLLRITVFPDAQKVKAQA